MLEHVLELQPDKFNKLCDRVFSQFGQPFKIVKVRQQGGKTLVDIRLKTGVKKSLTV